MKVRKIPRGTVWIGGLASVALCVPLLTLALHGLGDRLGLSRNPAPLDRTFWISLVFAGLPAFAAGGGVARLVAHRLAEQPHLRLRAAVWRGGATMAVAGIGLAILAGVPAGVLGEHPLHWLPYAIAGLAAGAVTGVAISVLAALRQRRFVAPRPAAGDAAA